MYIPNRGDVVCWSLEREQAGRRPAVILSPQAYNERVGLALCCPITSHAKGYPFEVPIPANEAGISGVILSDQVKSVDWKGRQARFIVRLPENVTAEVIQTLNSLLR